MARKHIVFAVLLLLALLIAGIALRHPALPTPTKNSMIITSNAFDNGAAIPKKYTCDGENRVPPLEVRGAPEGTVSYALIMDDPDAPRGTFLHWTTWNISPASPLIGGGVEGMNGAGRTGYIGPCPPPGTPHHYFFKLYALDAMLQLPAGALKSALEAEVEKHLLAKAELMGLYQR